MIRRFALTGSAVFSFLAFGTWLASAIPSVAARARFDVPCGKVCLRAPDSTSPQPFTNPGGCSVSATFTLNQNDNGDNGQCAPCTLRNCRWKGVIEVVNQGGDPIDVRVKWGAQTLGPGTVTIEPGMSKTWRFDDTLPCDDAKPTKGMLKVEFPTGGCSQPLQLELVCNECV